MGLKEIDQNRPSIRGELNQQTIDTCFEPFWDYPTFVLAHFMSLKVVWISSPTRVQEEPALVRSAGFEYLQLLLCGRPGGSRARPKHEASAFGVLVLLGGSEWLNWEREDIIDAEDAVIPNTQLEPNLLNSTKPKPNKTQLKPTNSTQLNSSPVDGFPRGASGSVALWGATDPQWDEEHLIPVEPGESERVAGSRSWKQGKAGTAGMFGDF